jgi:S1-C subfamily serine protease
MDPEPSVSRGIVSAVHRTLETTGHPEPAFLMDLIETDAQISPGESGGALVDRDGMLIGMCLAVYHPDAGIRGKAFALAADSWLRAGIDKMTGGEGFPIGSLGVEVAPLGIEAARGLPVAPRQGVFVAWPPRGGPSDTAGIKPGDVITAINGEPVTSVSGLRRIEMRLAPGSTARVQAARRGSSKPLEFEVSVGGQKGPVSAALLRFDWRGMAVSDIDDALRKEFSAPSRKGVIAVEIRRGGNAYKAGLRKGDVILEINNTTVDSLAAFKQAVESIPDSNVVRVRTTDGVGHIQGETPKG